MVAHPREAAASPGAAKALILMNSNIDVRGVLTAIHVPTLVLHRTGDRDSRPQEGRYIAERIEGARFVELDGEDHSPWIEPDQILDEVEEFLTGVRRGPDVRRVLATVLFTDIVGSTTKAVELGDSRWRSLLEQHHTAVRRELEQFRGSEIDTAGDGFLATFDGRHEQSGAHRRFGAPCARSVSTSRPECTPGKSSSPPTVRSLEWRSTSVRGWLDRPGRARCLYRARSKISSPVQGWSSKTAVSTSSRASRASGVSTL